MSQILTLLLIILLTVLGAASLSSCTGGETSPGDPAPPIDLTLFDGTRFVLAEHPETVVVNFWASWCVPCRREMPAIDRFARDHPEITVIGIAVDDSEEAARAFAAEVGAGYLLAIDDEDLTLRGYPRLGLPTTFVIVDGRLAARSDGELTYQELVNLVSP